MRCDFVKGLEWAISFVNNAVQTFAENKPDEITNIEIFFQRKTRKECIWVMDGCGWQISWNITFRWY